MENLTKDTIFLIALELNDVDLASFCKSNKKFNEQICKKDTIWNYKLKELKEYSKDIENLSKEVKTPRELYQLVKSLIVSREIFKVNWSLTELYNKKEIDLLNKGIKKIPNLSLFKNLKKLELDENKIIKIPDTLPNSLQELSLCFNKIIKIPNTLPYSLEELYLNDNKIKKVPNTLPNSLRHIEMNYNPIKKLPDVLPNSLEVFDLGETEIEEVPKKYENIVII